ncbi:unnamed protein product [Triticum turgidum subsp. durum]|uniref:Uncharacterized protein n=1 Tax=Triticum turgidum subsp. durum TaxID=4567 RepID=A0A9R1QHF8_TRITD|nr:unnamed protein product [Triticum turgidum subsp. durum]
MEVTAAIVAQGSCPGPRPEPQIPLKQSRQEMGKQIAGEDHQHREGNHDGTIIRGQNEISHPSNGRREVVDKVL